MKSNFDYCLKEVLKSEGGYSNDPSDSGGATNFGITITDYRKYIKKNGTPEDVKNMTVDQAAVIYKKRYWDALDCDNLPSGVDYTVFDYGVLSGLGRPRKDLQTFKDKTGADLINAINDERTAFLTTISNASNPKYAHNAKYRKGWLSRVARVRKSSLNMLGNKDNTSGPAAGTVVAAGLAGTFWDHIIAHPYLATSAVLVTAAAVWSVVHYLRNK